MPLMLGAPINARQMLVLPVGKVKTDQTDSLDVLFIIGAP